MRAAVSAFFAALIFAAPASAAVMSFDVVLSASNFVNSVNSQPQTFAEPVEVSFTVEHDFDVSVADSSAGLTNVLSTVPLLPVGFTYSAPGDSFIFGGISGTGGVSSTTTGENDIQVIIAGFTGLSPVVTTFIYLPTNGGIFSAGVTEFSVSEAQAGVVPVPAAGLLLVTGLAALGWRGRRA
ncbi:MAG: VPLPA-CTERM sorting domain-containing protein [Pseudomonadota bacterium]